LRRFIFIRKAGYCAEVQLVIDRANTEGFTLPSAATLTAMCTLIASMKTSGFWALQDVIFNMAYNDVNCANFSRINIKKPSDTLADRVGGLTYTAYGDKGNASDAYWNTNWNPSTYGGNYTLNNAGRGVVIFSEITGSSRWIDGTSSNVNGFQNINGLNHRINQGISNVPTNTDLSGTGLKSINRDDATNLRLYNKATELNMAVASTSIFNSNQYIMRTSSTYKDLGLSIYFAGGSDSQAITQQFRTDYNAYLVSIGLTGIA
jgi:hypothetical protein